MKSWKRIEPTTTTKIGWRTIVSKTFIMPNGEMVVFDTMWPDGQQFAAVIALTPDKKVIISRQFRPGPEKVMDELPGGFVDNTESPEETGRRELLEETGYATDTMEYIGASHKDTFLNATWHYLIALDCKKVSAQKLEREEHIEIEEISIDELLYNASHDNMTDVAGVMMAYDRLKQLQAAA